MDSTTGSENIMCTREGAVAVITINRPEKLNSVTPDMSHALDVLIRALNVDPEIRAVVLTGAGERAFCCGSDISTLDSYDTPWDFRNRTDYCDALRELSKPLIGAINGYAFGGGLETALLCDIRIAAENASFAAVEIKLGWIGGGGVSYGLTEAAGSSNASYMLLTGDAVDSATALRWNLVTRVVPAASLMTDVMALAKTIAERPPIAAEHAKVNVRTARESSFSESMKYERDLQTVAFATEDAREGRRAFTEKRPGVFRRR